MKKALSIKNILIAFGIFIFDLAVYLILGMLLMNYDDFYDESKGEYWGLESMTFWQKANYVGLYLWHVINLIVIGYVIYRVIKILRKNIPLIIALTLLSCSNPDHTKETTDSEAVKIAQDTVLVEIENEIDSKFEKGFYSKSYTYCWIAGKDTLDLKIELTELDRDSSLDIRVFNQKPILFKAVIDKLNECRPLIEEKFNLNNLSSLYFEPPIRYKDLTTELSQDYKSKFGKTVISYQQLNEFLMRSWLEQRISGFLDQFGKTTRRYVIEKFHLLDKKYYNAYIPNSSNLKEYPEFSINGMGILVEIKE